MSNAHLLIAAGMMSPKDWISLAIDIEQFRKQEQGNQEPPGDWLEKWLTAPSAPNDAPIPVVQNVIMAEGKPKRGRIPKGGHPLEVLEVK